CGQAAGPPLAVPSYRGQGGGHGAGRPSAVAYIGQGCGQDVDPEPAEAEPEHDGGQALEGWPAFAPWGHGGQAVDGPAGGVAWGRGSGPAWGEPRVPPPPCRRRPESSRRGRNRHRPLMPKGRRPSSPPTGLGATRDRPATRRRVPPPWPRRSARPAAPGVTPA